MEKEREKQLRRMIDVARDAIGFLLPLQGIHAADKAREHLGNAVWTIEDEIANPRAFPGGPTLKSIEKIAAH